MNNKTIASILIISFMIVSAVMVVPGETDAVDPVNKVTITIGWNSDYMAHGDDAVNRIAAANVQIDSDGYDTLPAAVNAFKKLYATGSDGRYSGTYIDYNGTSRTYTSANPLYYRASDNPSSYDKNPIDSVRFTVYGTVTGGTGIAINTNGSYYRIPSISIVGSGIDAKITGQTSLSANPAGGYEQVFTPSGTLRVSNIEFTATSGHTSIEVDGSTYSGSGSATTTLIVEQCTFHNQLYSYVNDRTSTITKIIRNNSFTNDGSVGYAYFLQGQADTIRFENNLVDGYSRGINIQEEESDVDATIVGNTFMNNSAHDRGCIQITQVNDVLITGNTFSNIVSNAIWLWNNESSRGHCNSLTVTNNNIQADYLINSDQEGVYIQITDNNLEITYPGYCMEKDSSSPSVSDVAVDYSNNGGPSTDDEGDEPPFLPGQGTNTGSSTDNGTDDSKKLTIAAAAIVVIMLAAVAMMATRNH